MQKVIVGLSGGVDSALTACLLKARGFEVEALFMKNWEGDDERDHCPAEQDLKDAKAVCDTLQIPLHTANFSKVYWDRVFQYFLDEYAAGRTPNPDILCNKEVKFKAFLAHAETLGADWIATGHYVRIDPTRAGSPLLKAADPAKDQTYFLYAVEPTALRKTLCPLGDYLKTEVRALAKANHLPVHDKKDSTGICFVGERRFKPFLKEYLLAQPGKMVSVDGECLGRHEGLMFYTLGQRQGLQIGGQKHAQELPWYVVDKIVETNTLVVAQGVDHPRLFAAALQCGPIHWLGAPPTAFPFHCTAKIRYRQAEQACQITPLAADKYRVSFELPQRAVTPGQSVVFYDEDACLGGAIIMAASS